MKVRALHAPEQARDQMCKQHLERKQDQLANEPREPIEWLRIICHIMPLLSRRNNGNRKWVLPLPIFSVRGGKGGVRAKNL